MVAQFDPSDEEQDRLRFPVGPDLRPATARALQIRVAPNLAQALWSARPVLPLAENAPVAAFTDHPHLRQLAEFLQAHGATAVTWPLDDNAALNEILTDEEKNERRAIIEVTFRQQDNVVNLLPSLLTLPAVKAAIPVPEEAPPSHSDDTLMGHSDRDLTKQWYLYRMRVDDAWDDATGKDVVIADVDFGFFTGHSDLTNLDMAKAFNSHDRSATVDHGTHITHGTAVMGLAGAAMNRAGMVGVAYEASLWPIQANSGPGTKVEGDKWARGIDYVVTTSSGGRRKVAILEVQTKKGACYEQLESTRLSIKHAMNHGVVVVVAAGNGSRDVSLNDKGDPYPESGSILVGATSYHAKHNPRACFSNYGDRITVSAPGYGPSDLTCSTVNNNAHRISFGGTSGAAPKVAGVCALMLSRNPTLTVSDVKQILITTGTEVLTSPNRPSGVFVDAKEAVDKAR